MYELDWESYTTGPRRPTVTRGDTGWVRARLAHDLHERYYHLFGLQALPVEYGPRIGTLSLASVHCRRAPRSFGKLADGGVAATTGYPPGLKPHATEGHLPLESHPWETWEELRGAAIEALQLTTAHVSGHAGCFHRSSRALYPIIFDVVVVLAMVLSRFQTDWSLEWARPDSHAASFADMLGIGPDHWDRYLVVYRGPDWRGVALGNDGVVLGQGGDSTDLAQAWRSGASIGQLAEQALAISGLV